MFIKIVLCAKIGIDVRNLEMKETVVKSTCKLVSVFQPGPGGLRAS